jgi:hypothetical protein
MFKKRRKKAEEVEMEAEPDEAAAVAPPTAPKEKKKVSSRSHRMAVGPASWACGIHTAMLNRSCNRGSRGSSGTGGSTRRGDGRTAIRADRVGGQLLGPSDCKAGIGAAVRLCPGGDVDTRCKTTVFPFAQQLTKRR